MFELDDDIFEHSISDVSVENTSNIEYIGLASLPEFGNTDTTHTSLVQNTPKIYEPLTAIEIIKKFPDINCQEYKFNNINIKMAHYLLPREYFLTLLNTNLHDIGFEYFTGVTNEILKHYVDDIKEIDIFISYVQKYYSIKLSKFINIYIPIEHLVLPSIRLYISKSYSNITNLLELFVELSTNKLYDLDENYNILNIMSYTREINYQDYVELVIKSDYITSCAFKLALQQSYRSFRYNKIIQKFGIVTLKNSIS
jgi:hypothetical protein